MSGGNAQTLFQRKHGVCTARFSFLASLLLGLWCLEAWGSGPQGDARICSPCPVNCSCTAAAQKRSSCVVNCSNIGLERAPAATDIPLATTVLDLSRNHISSLDTSLLDRLVGLQELYLQWNQIKVLPRGTFCCGSLSVVNLSNNQITTIEDRICDNQCNLTQIDLSNNPFDCDCKLFRLVSWLEEKGVQVRRPDAMLCHHPPELRYQPVLNISLLTCGLNYAACLEDSGSEGVKRSELVIFSSSTPGNFTRQQCNSVCFAASHRYGGLGARHECLCSTNSEPNFISESQCSAACSNPHVMKECGWTLAVDVFAVDFSIALKNLPLPQSVHDPVALVTTSSVSPVFLTWDFGDVSPRLNTTGTGLNTEYHKYGLPGHYTVTVVARAGNKEVSARTEIMVVVPPKLELRCPSLAVANKSLSLTIVSWGSIGLDLDWKIKKDGVQVAEASPHCPKDGMFHSESSSCFQIVPTELSWTDAQQQCSVRGGDLAVVRSDTLSNLLGQKVTLERGVWLGLSDVNSPGKLHWVNGSEATEGEEGSPPRSLIARGNVCVSLDPHGQTSSHLCSAKRAFICQYKPQVRVPDTGIFVLGLPLFPSTTLLHHTPLRTVAPQAPRDSVEVLLFPALSFVQTGRLSSLEFVTQKLSSEVQVRFQTYRPYCRRPDLQLLLPGCGGPICAQVALCVQNNTRTSEPHSCPQLEQWCPFQQRCLALSSFCPSSACPNCTQGHLLPPEAHRPHYTLQNELVFNLPAGPAAHVVVQKLVEDFLVIRGDVIALQHDAGHASFLSCQSPSLSPWRQPVLVLNQSEWISKNNGRDTANTLTDTEADPPPEIDIEKLVEDGERTWQTDVVCPVRLLYMEQSETQLPTEQLSAGLSQPGLYTLLVTSAKPSFSASASCPLQVEAPLCLTVLHPQPQNGTFYFQANDTKLLLSVQSRYVTHAFIPGSNSSVTFRPEFPSEFPSKLAHGSTYGGGQKATKPTLFAVLDLCLVVEDQKSPIQVTLEAYNNVTETTLMITVQVEVPLKGLLVQPNPEQRVLMESVVSYTASVLEGSNPTFKWIVDDKPHFTYYNTVLNVIYQHAAIYKLTVTAVNHVSSIKEHYNVTVDHLQPMANLTVSGVPDFVPQGSTQTLTTSVLLDMSVDATLRWVFGDNGYKEFKFKPPYDPALRCPHSPNQVKLSNNVTYVYSQPGIYTAVVSVSNRYDNISRSVNMSVYSMLTHVDIQTEPGLLLAGESAEFEAHPLPSPYGIYYVWDFGDGSCQSNGRRVGHSYTQSGAFDVCVLVNNTISFKKVCVEMFVFEKINNLTAQSPSFIEIYSPVTVWANHDSGNNITWTFSMGDGAVYAPSKPQVTHVYNKEGNYSVNVTATNAVSFCSTVLPLHVLGFQVIGIEPSGCVQEQSTVNFKALVSGNITAHSYEWSFGDGSPNETHHGNPRVTHTYHVSGNYHLTLLLSSGVNSVVKMTFSHWVCVQPSLTNISLQLQKSHYAVGEDVLFQVKAKPDYNYTYQWVFGGEKELALIHGSGKMERMYKIPGAYVVSVTVYNNISSSNVSVVVDVMMPVGPVFIQHNGTKYNNLSLNAPYQFTTSSLASNVSYTWNFGDGNVFIGQNHHHVYNISGKYNVTLTAINTVSRNHTVLPITVLAPILGLTINASLTNVPLNASVHFEAKIEEGDDVRYSWILCDRCTSIPGTNTMFYTFRSVGTFNIIVTAENDIGTTQTSIFLFVQRELEGLQIQAEKESAGGSEPDTCFSTNRVLHLQASLKEGTNMTFSWNFIREFDPDSSLFNISGKSVEVNFSTPGPCEIFLKATNLLGQLCVNKTIYFLDPAKDVSLEISNNPVAVDALTNLTVLTQGGSDLQYRWSVNGDILHWNLPWKTHSFSSPGHKLVTVDVFNKVSSHVVSEIVNVQETISGLRFTATNVTEQSYVATGTNITLQGELVSGTDVTWTWLVDGRTRTGKRTSVIIQEPKTAIVVLNATNDVSGQVVSREFFAQEKIQGLDLKASAKIAAVGQKVEFNISMAAGSDVHLILSISGDATVITQPNKTYVHLFSRVDTYMVNLTAHNQVSSKRRHLQVEVMEPVRGLSILGTFAAIPVGVKKLFVANIVTGKPVQFIWTFDLHHLHRITHMGKEISYTPEEPGLLTIYLRAINSLQAQNITKHILVQNLLMSAILDATPQETFIKKTVFLTAYIRPAATPVECVWKFGDGSQPRHTSTTTVGYEYNQPGIYLVQVNCSNLVSWVLAQVEVSISVLQCEEPEVQLIQAPRLAIWRSQPTMIEASVDLRGCVRYGAQYLWQILATPYCDNVMDNPLPSGSMTQPLPSLAVPVIRLPVEVDVRRLQLSLPKMSLATGNYTLVFSLSYEGVPLRKAACLHLSVMAARLVPIIEGGTYRVWSRTQDLQLSAEQSYDPNMDPGNQSLLNYHWECESTSKGREHCSTFNFSLGSSGPVLGISGSELEAGVEYTFKLTISKDGMVPESTTQTVLVQSGHIPMVYLACVSCKAQSIYVVSQNSYVYLKGTCTNCQNIHRGRWSAMTLQNETLVLDSSSTTTGSRGMNLVLRRGVLRHNNSYIFTLRVTDDALDGEGVASITLHHNMPPAGGKCHLRGDNEMGLEYLEDQVWRIRTLLDRVHFNCSGYSDLGISETPLLYSLMVTRCRGSYCEDFCVYRGSSPEHSAFLPPGFRSSQNRVDVFIKVEDHQGAADVALNKSIEVVLPVPPPEYSSLPHWLSHLTDNKLKKLLEQGDSQRVREISLALITVLNEYEQTRESVRDSRVERNYRVRVRSNITRALTSLDLTTVSDIQQTSAALAQCTAVSREFICEECQNSTLNKLESMLAILQTDTKQGTVTPTEIADNILNIMGDLIHQVSQSASQPYLEPAFDDFPSPGLSSTFTATGEVQPGIILEPSPSSLEPHPLQVAMKAYNLSSVLMLILMHARVLNEEPLVLKGAEIAATGKLADPQSLLCYDGNNSPECKRFSIPRAFNDSLGKAAAGNSIMQLLFQVEPNPFPFNYVANYTISTEVASMEFRTEDGTHIPITDLDDDLAITVVINNGSSGDAGPESTGAGGLPAAGAINISHCDSVIMRVSPGNTNRQAGLFIQLNFTQLEDEGNGADVTEPYISAYLHSHDNPNKFNYTDSKHITLGMTRGPGLDHKKYTFFLSPESYDTTLDYFVNVVTPCNPDLPPASVQLEVGLFAYLCQYFSESEKQWRTDGMVPLAETNASTAVCRTRHLTAFAAGLFVPTNAITFKVPERSDAPSLVVLLVCVLGLLSYVVAGAILHKLDQLDLRQAGVVPFCGQDGLFKYEVQVKTGLNRGAGTTAHVGISLFGRESRSGHRHLDRRGAFSRNALDIFHIATDTSLGNVWKIRVWHDNKGLSPAWMLQYVLVKDLQTGSSYYFLVEDWLSVDNEKTDGQVEIEVEASEEEALLQLSHLMKYELQRALCESHLWMSLWERPPRSPFTRLQRATCCAVLLQLFLLCNTLWCSVVVDSRYSRWAVSRLSSLNGETLAAGVVTCLIAYPLYLLVFTLFRMSRSKCVSVEHSPEQLDQESVEIDDFFDNSLTGSSFLFFNGETNSEESNINLPTPSTKSVDSWAMEEEDTEDRDWMEPQSDMSVVDLVGHGPGLPKLKRGQGSRHLGVNMTLNPDDEDGTRQQGKYFTSSDEDLIKHILADGQNFFPQTSESELADLSSIFGDKTEVILLQRLNEPLPFESVRRDPPKKAFTSNTVVTDVCRPRRFPPWCGQATLWGSWAVIALGNALSIWAGHSFSPSVAMMWLISCFTSFLCSCFILEPIKVICEAVYYAVFVRRLRPEDQDVLVEFPHVEKVVQRVPRVRAPQGFALSQAQHQARKVNMLHNMLKNFLLYMLFLLVVLLLNYSDSAKDAHSLRLRTQLQQALQRSGYHNISSRECVLTWLNESLLPWLLDDSALLRNTGTVLLGTVKMQQISNSLGHRARWGFLGSDKTMSSHEETHNFSAFITNDNWGQPVNQDNMDYNVEMVHQFNGSLEEASYSFLQLKNPLWLNLRIHTVSVKFSLYNINTNLLAVFSFLFEFPVSEQVQSSLDLHVFTLRLITGLDLQLLLMIIVFILVLYFLVNGILTFSKEGYRYFLSAWRLVGVCKLALAATLCGLHLSCCVTARQLWVSYLKHLRDDFTDFYPLARMTRLYSVMSALLLFILVLKASHQLRFLREWAVFGRALRHSVWELLGVIVALVLVILAYSHTGHLLFHTVLDGYNSVSSSCLSLLRASGPGWFSPGSRSPMTNPSGTLSSLVFHTSFSVFHLMLLCLIISVLLRNYRRARAELYCVSVDLQDYEMVELFLRRLKMWMGLSSAKEFRHKVRFEGIEMPPSRSSSTSDCKSLCLPPLDGPDSPSTPDSVDAGSEASWRPASSSPCSLTEAPGMNSGLGLNLGLGQSPGLVVGGTTWREKVETEASLKRLLPTLEALLQQLDRVTVATADLYHLECKLERAQRKTRQWERERAGGDQERGEVAYGRKGGKRNKDSAGRKETKNGKEKHRGHREGKRNDKLNRSKDNGHLGKIPVATPVPSSKPRATPASALALSPQLPGRTSVCERPLTTVTDTSVPESNPESSESPPTPIPTQLSQMSASYPCVSTPSVSTPCPTASQDCDPPKKRETFSASSLFNHPAHTTIIPTCKRKRKPPPLKNKVHPNVDRHSPGHPKF